PLPLTMAGSCPIGANLSEHPPSSPWPAKSRPSRIERNDSFAARTRGHWVAGSSPLLSGLNFWTKRMALIHLGSERFATFWTRKGTSSMRHHNSVLHQILKHIPWSEFERVVEDHESDKHVRRLTTKSQLIAMLFAQLSGSVSLREIIAG